MRISGKSFDVTIGSSLVHVDAMSASIEDNRSTVKDGGVPNGYVDGDVGCSGELELDWDNFQLMLEEARRAGSWRGMDTFDIVVYANTGKTEAKVELFDCLLKISDLLDIDPNGGEKSKVKLPFDVTGRDFVHIGGLPYLRPEEIEDLN
ncbi:phage protein [Endozoicomonas ascidiicola]|uniref:phage protein n=1 Tax=Endozoicomonas ascidiicola TaxID=1698521 RepID=UPI0008338E03|nr:phage protein [Endozoicomonas ascidiicola]